MSYSASSGQAQNDAQAKLKSCLKQEVHMMREILANMHQEELSLLMHDHTAWLKIMEARSDMVVMLKNLRHERGHVTNHLQMLIGKSEKIELKMDELIPLDDELRSELQSLLDQILALTERINLQNCRNDHLFHQPRNESGLPLHCSYPMREAQKRMAKKKASPTTLP